MFPKRPADGSGAWQAAGQWLGCLVVGEYLGNAGGLCRRGKLVDITPHDAERRRLFSSVMTGWYILESQ